MEILLVLILGGAFFLFARPLKDWYVVDIQDASGTSLELQIFTGLEAAQQAFDHVVATKAQPSAKTIHLRHLEARSRKALRQLMADQGSSAAPLRSVTL
ncbi:hypothetical protein [Azohydromonas caseinilytica]|uniref:Uncharacterized protein n=1 Tax=Azohydromonas caseinilytica TaxID=2728836 RepID=A0A848FGU8_9BURK|nr:hypothetical protein [Azohydromonas caseinilytica]NML17483.1 hypothetical protein [Azohydromonas caseinilytica]